MDIIIICSLLTLVIGLVLLIFKRTRRFGGYVAVISAVIIALGIAYAAGYVMNTIDAGSRDVFSGG